MQPSRGVLLSQAANGPSSSATQTSKRRAPACELWPDHWTGNGAALDPGNAATALTGRSVGAGATGA